MAAQREVLIDNLTRCDDDFAELYLELMYVVDVDCCDVLSNGAALFASVPLR